MSFFFFSINYSVVKDLHIHQVTWASVISGQEGELGMSISCKYLLEPGLWGGKVTHVTTCIPQEKPIRWEWSMCMCIHVGGHVCAHVHGGQTSGVVLRSHHTFFKFSMAVLPTGMSLYHVPVSWWHQIPSYCSYSCKLPCKCSDLNPGALEEQPVLS